MQSGRTYYLKKNVLPVMEGRPAQGLVTPGTLSCQDGLPTTCDPEPK